MGFSQDAGYTPPTVGDLMLSVMENINTQFGTSYTEDTFVGTNFYKYFYALIQKLQENEVKTSEIFLKLQEYFAVTNERISKPSVTNPGLVEILSTNGFVASVKKPIDADAGKVYICVDLDDTDDDYEDDKATVAEIIKDSTVAGVVTQGAEVTAIVLSNGQSFDFKYDLPNRIPIALRLTTTLSENNQNVILTPEEVKEILLDNIEAKYKLGKNFEPQKYFSLIDAPWAASVLLEYTDDVTGDVVDVGATWTSAIYDAAYDDLFVVSLARTQLVEN